MFLSWSDEMSTTKKSPLGSPKSPIDAKIDVTITRQTSRSSTRSVRSVKDKDAPTRGNTSMYTSMYSAAAAEADNGDD